MPGQVQSAYVFFVECHPSNGLNAKEKHLQLHLVLKQTAPGTVHERPAKHQQGSTFYYTLHPACEKIPLFQVSRKPGCSLYREPEGPEPLPGGQASLTRKTFRLLNCKGLKGALYDK